MIMKS